MLFSDPFRVGAEPENEGGESRIRKRVLYSRSRFFAISFSFHSLALFSRPFRRNLSRSDRSLGRSPPAPLSFPLLISP